MRPPRGRPSCRARDLAAGTQRDPHAAGVAGRVGAMEAEACGPDEAAATCVRSTERPKDGGDRETKGGSAGGGGVGCGRQRGWGTPCTRESAAARARSGDVRQHRGQVGALSAVLAVGGPVGQQRHGRKTNSVPRATRPNRGALGSCHGYEGGGGIGPEITAKSVLPQSTGPLGRGGPL